MQVLVGLIACALPIAAAAEDPAGAVELVSKRYEFKVGARLAMDAATTSGLRLDTVRFKMPVARGERIPRTAGLPSADVAVSNTSDRPVKVGLAIALFDGEGRDGVNAEAHRAATFQISLESKP
jgi:hypothetical protein